MEGLKGSKTSMQEGNGEESVKIMPLETSLDNTSSTNDDSNAPKKTLNLTSAILYLAGSIIGTGIFMSASEVTIAIPSIFYSLLFWLLCGMVSLGAGLCYAELGLLMPSCGGEYFYFLSAFHDFAGFSFMFSNLLFIKPISIAILVLFAAETMTSTFMEHPGFWVPRIISLVIVVLLCILHCTSNYISIKINDSLTYSKFIGMAIIAGIAIYKLIVDGPVNLYDWGFNISVDAGNISTAIYNCMWTYDGFNMLAYMVEEMKDPHKNLVFASVVGLSLVTLVYIIMNLCYYTVLGVSGMIMSSNAAFALAQPYMGRFTFFLSIFVALSALGSGNSTAYSGARIYFDAARNNHVPELLSAVHRTWKTVIPSLILQAFLTIIYLLATPDIPTLLSYFSNAAWIYYTLSILSVIILRYRKPGPRIFKMPIVLVILLALISASFVILGFYQDWLTSTISTVMVFSSLPFYLFFVHKKSFFVKQDYSFMKPVTVWTLRRLNLEISRVPL